MTHRQLVASALRNADDTSEYYKGDEACTSTDERVHKTWNMFALRAVCAALLAIADAVDSLDARRK
jgi:hypothetical protein